MSDENLHAYTETEVPAKLKQLGLDAWYVEDGWIRRKFNTDGWRSTLMLVNAIGFLAEAADHHPDLTVTYAKLWVKLKTHSRGAVTDKDFTLARKIEDVTLWRPDAGSPLQGAAKNEFVKLEK